MVEASNLVPIARLGQCWMTNPMVGEYIFEGSRRSYHSTIAFLLELAVTPTGELLSLTVAITHPLYLIRGFLETDQEASLELWKSFDSADLVQCLPSNDLTRIQLQQRLLLAPSNTTRSWAEIIDQRDFLQIVR